MLCHQVQRPPRSYRRCTRLQRVSVELANEGDVAHWIVPGSGTEVEIVNRKCLLKDCWIRTLREGHQYRVDMSHVVTTNHIRSIGKSIWMTIICRAQHQSGGIDGSARDNDDVTRV